MATERPLEILVIEDNLEFTAAAKYVYDKLDSRVHAGYASTYEEAMAYLQSNSVGGVITDLFFPSDNDWKASFISEYESKVNEDIEFWESEPKSQYHERAIADCKKMIIDARNLNENPSGLGIALYCIDKGLPFVIVSQGERHRGNLATVRGITMKVEQFRELSKDFMRDNLLYTGGEVDKRNPDVWRDAVYSQNNGLLAKGKRYRLE